MKYLIGIIAIVLIIMGWLLSNSKKLSFVYPIFAPEYLKAKSALEKMTKKKVLKEEDKGFSEISKLLMEKFVTIKEEEKAKKMSLRITQIEILETLITFKEKSGQLESGSTLELNVTFSNGQTLQGKIFNLASMIEYKYLTSKIFLWGSIFFWIGIAISIFNIFLRPLVFPASIQE